MDDLISRQAAINETWREPRYTDALNALTEVRERIRSLPSVKPDLQPTCNQLETDCISRQAAIDVLHGYFDGMLETDTICPKYLYNLFEIIPSTQQEQRWIPVSERLPEESGRYLVTRGLNACGSLWNRIYIANYSDLMGLKSTRIWWQGNVGKSDFERLKDVIAWMPLPEPYAERKDNE